MTGEQQAFSTSSSKVFLDELWQTLRWRLYDPEAARRLKPLLTGPADQASGGSREYNVASVIEDSPIDTLAYNGDDECLSIADSAQSYSDLDDDYDDEGIIDLGDENAIYGFIEARSSPSASSISACLCDNPLSKLQMAACGKPMQRTCIATDGQDQDMEAEDDLLSLCSSLGTLALPSQAMEGNEEPFRDLDHCEMLCI